MNFTKIKNYLEYLKKLFLHKCYVFDAGLKIKVPLVQLILHNLDCAKYSEFVCTYGEAMLHHVHHAKHHWQHWIVKHDNGVIEVFDMPDKYIREMVAEWFGASRAMNGHYGIRKWYKKNRNIMTMTIKTRDTVEAVISEFYDAMEKRKADKHRPSLSTMVKAVIGFTINTAIFVWVYKYISKH